ncbi:helix-turn-helix domain-containing protein [Streptomyces adustus]|uniref:helix-turn-helix domain-containing protein n=1 Tax=Streptomyces adustus TaxID=1609272 RepID=UPI00371CE297
MDITISTFGIDGHWSSVSTVLPDTRPRERRRPSRPRDRTCRHRPVLPDSGLRADGLRWRSRLSRVPGHDSARPNTEVARRQGAIPRVDVRRKLLPRAALEVFVEQGCHATAMSDIVERAGVIKPVLCPLSRARSNPVWRCWTSTWTLRSGRYTARSRRGGHHTVHGSDP